MNAFTTSTRPVLCLALATAFIALGSAVCAAFDILPDREYQNGLTEIRKWSDENISKFEFSMARIASSVEIVDARGFDDASDKTIRFQVQVRNKSEIRIQGFVLEVEIVNKENSKRIIKRFAQVVDTVFPNTKSKIAFIVRDDDLHTVLADDNWTWWLAPRLVIKEVDNPLWKWLEEPQQSKFGYFDALSDLRPLKFWKQRKDAQFVDVVDPIAKSQQSQPTKFSPSFSDMAVSFPNEPTIEEKEVDDRDGKPIKVTSAEVKGTNFWVKAEAFPSDPQTFEFLDKEESIKRMREYVRHNGLAGASYTWNETNGMRVVKVRGTKILEDAGVEIPTTYEVHQYYTRRAILSLYASGVSSKYPLDGTQRFFDSIERLTK